MPAVRTSQKSHAETPVEFLDDMDLLYIIKNPQQKVRFQTVIGGGCHGGRGDH